MRFLIGVLLVVAVFAVGGSLMYRQAARARVVAVRAQTAKAQTAKAQAAAAEAARTRANADLAHLFDSSFEVVEDPMPEVRQTEALQPERRQPDAESGPEAQPQDTPQKRLARSAAALAAARAANKALRGKLVAAEKRLAEVTRHRRQLRERVFELEAELEREETRRQKLDALIEQTSAELTTARQRYNEELRAARSFMPEGVRVALVTINKAFSDDGHPGMRLLGARSIEDKILREVQFLSYDPEALMSVLYLAKEMTFDLDRVTGNLNLCFRDGHAQSRLGRENFPPNGKRLVVEAVDGRRWERELPYLVTGLGEYPTLTEDKPKPRRMDEEQRRSWIARVNKLLDKAQTKPRYRLGDFRTLQGGKFIEPLLLGYDDKKRLSMSAEPDTLWVHCDPANKAVELRMTGGKIRRAGGERKLGPAGYRIRLTGLRPADAEEAMLGMVKTQ